MITVIVNLIFVIAVISYIEVIPSVYGNTDKLLLLLLLGQQGGGGGGGN